MVLGLVLVHYGCHPTTDEALLWPKLPNTFGEARALISKMTVRAPRGALNGPPATAAEIVDLLVRRQSEGALAAGWPSILERLASAMSTASKARRDAYLLFGTHHDSGDQVRAFRRVTGPGGLPGLSAVIVEQLEADGRWAGVAPADQSGDSEDLQRLHTATYRPALERLIARQRSGNYTGWKYRYLREFTDLFLAARAQNQRLLACDMPDPLLRRIRHLPVDEQDRLREIHCRLATRRTMGPTKPVRVAMLWGMDHVAHFPALLEEEALVLSLYVMGGRPGTLGREADLGRRLRVTHPVLIPMDSDGHHALLLLDSGRLGEPLSRSRGPADPVMAPGLTVITDHPVTLSIAKSTYTIQDTRDIPLAKGSHVFVLKRGDRTVVGAVVLSEKGAAEMSLFGENPLQITYYE